MSKKKKLKKQVKKHEKNLKLQEKINIELFDRIMRLEAKQLNITAKPLYEPPFEGVLIRRINEEDE
jgi:hypothetical protein